MLLFFAQQNNAVAPTVVTLNAVWSGFVNDSGTKSSGTGEDGVAASASPPDFRAAAKWNPRAITGVLFKIELIVNITQVVSFSAQSVFVGAYNGDGQADCEADTGATMFARCEVSGDNYGSFIEFRTVALQTMELSGAVADFTAARTAGSVYSLGFRCVDEAGSAHESDWSDYLTANPPKLRVTFFSVDSFAAQAWTGRRTALLAYLVR